MQWGCPWMRSINLAQSGQKINWCTVGAVSWKYLCMSASAGGPRLSFVKT